MHKFTLNYDSNNHLQKTDFHQDETSPKESVTITRDGLMNSTVVVFANDFGSAVDQANKAMGAPTSQNQVKYSTPRSFIERQIEARILCDKILTESSLLSNDAPIKVPVGLFRFMVDALDIAGASAKEN